MRRLDIGRAARRDIDGIVDASEARWGAAAAARYRQGVLTPAASAQGWGTIAEAGVRLVASAPHVREAHRLALALGAAVYDRLYLAGGGRRRPAPHRRRPLRPRSPGRPEPGLPGAVAVSRGDPRPEARIRDAAGALDFGEAARLRDKLKRLKRSSSPSAQPISPVH